MTNVYLLEDEVLIADGLKFRFRSPNCSFKVVGYTNKLSIGIEKIKQLHPDIILLDLFFGKSDPVQNFRTLKYNFPSIPIIIYSSEGCLWWKWRMMFEGAFGYVVKEWEVDELKHTICKATEGHFVYPGDLLLYFAGKNFVKGIGTLNSKELDLIRFRREGMQYKEIAKIFKISVSAIEKKITKLCDVFNTYSIDEITNTLF